MCQQQLTTKTRNNKSLEILHTKHSAFPHKVLLSASFNAITIINIILCFLYIKNLYDDIYIVLLMFIMLYIVSLSIIYDVYNFSLAY